jgi:hypothetical protein
MKIELKQIKVEGTDSRYNSPYGKVVLIVDGNEFVAEISATGDIDYFIEGNQNDSQEDIDEIELFVVNNQEILKSFNLF